MKSKEIILNASFYKALINSCHVGIMAIDINGKTVVFNKAAQRISNREEQEILGKHQKEVHPEYWAEYEDILKSGVPQFHRKLKAGNLTLIANRTPIIIKNRVIGVVSAFMDISELELQLKRSKRLANEYHSKLEELRTQQDRFDGFIAVSKQIKDVLELALRVAKVDVPVLIQGETGVGKEVIAKLIHKESDRCNNGIFMKINCGAIPENLLESELFGYEKGAFTGANTTGKKGLFELAEGGTLFLDEVNALSLHLQIKLLSALQDLEIMRIGGNKPIKINTRIIAASNQDLSKMLQDGTFRKDLFFRLNVVPINIHPLRERRDDIIPFANYFLEKYNAKYKKTKYFSRPVIDYLIIYHWPGNVRELENLIERLVVITKDNEIIFEDLPLHIRSINNIPSADFKPDNIFSFKKAVLEFESDLIQEAINRHGSVRKAAKSLNVAPSTITRKRKRSKTIVA